MGTTGNNRLSGDRQGQHPERNDQQLARRKEEHRLDETDLKEVQRDVGGTIGNRGISDNQPLLMRHNGRVVVGD
jgi:hypothetical protein